MQERGAIRFSILFLNRFRFLASCEATFLLISIRSGFDLSTKLFYYPFRLVSQTVHPSALRRNMPPTIYLWPPWPSNNYKSRGGGYLTTTQCAAYLLAILKSRRRRSYFFSAATKSCIWSVYTSVENYTSDKLAFAFSISWEQALASDIQSLKLGHSTSLSLKSISAYSHDLKPSTLFICLAS